ncbi:hypothetical protein CB1_000731036 [Camelus ferus]|nr:hypothetical protein CB1_000731036 [Camelus ferus]
MSFHKEDGVSSLCQKALHIVTELCFAGQVEWEKCSSIFPPDRGSQGGGSTGLRDAFGATAGITSIFLRRQDRGGLGGLRVARATSRAGPQLSAQRDGGKACALGRRRGAHCQ